jgi:hypothetical protein
MGIKAPRGLGWFTNPKKALYNRIYNRTTFSIDDLARAGAPRRRASGWGLGVVAVIAVGVVGTFVTRRDGPSVSGSPRVAEAAVTATPASPVVRTAVACVLRRSANAKSDRVGSIPVDTEVSTEQTDGNWSRVTKNGVSGWIHSRCLTH